MLACTLLSIPIFVAGFGAGKIPARNLAGHARAEALVDEAQAAPRPAGLYRGRAAAQWAASYRTMWKKHREARRALRQAIAAPRYTSSLEAAFLCIHGFEGSWTDPGSPHWGGLQMDMDFQRSYGDWALAAFGTADHWPVSVQLAVAIRAKVSGRGFYPWPNTARMCGLI